MIQFNEGYRIVKVQRNSLLHESLVNRPREERPKRGKNLNEQCVRTTNEIWETYDKDTLAERNQQETSDNQCEVIHNRRRVTFCLRLLADCAEKLRNGQNHNIFNPSSC